MKGILGDLGEMKILLKPDAKPMQQRPYRLNPRYKDCVKADIEWMLDAGIIKPIKELEWISPMVVQDKKTVKSMLSLQETPLGCSSRMPGKLQCFFWVFRYGSSQ